MTEKINFIMSGSISGARGMEAQLVIQQIHAKIPNIGRFMLVVWEDETNTDVFQSLKNYPVEIIVAKTPKRNSQGFPERQYKAMVCALPHFQPDDLIVRIRTDYNILLAPLLTFIQRMSTATSVVSMLRGRILTGEVSVFHPGRAHEFNFAGARRSFDKINWCESYFSEDYHHTPMEPEFRWMGLYYAMKDPLFQHMYEHFNVRQVMTKFFRHHYGRGAVSTHEFPPIIKYLTWRLANINIEERLCFLSNLYEHTTPDSLLGAQNADVSNYHDYIPDLRIRDQSAMCDLAGISRPTDAWKEFHDVARTIHDQEIQSPGTTIEMFNTFAGKQHSNDSHFLGNKRYDKKVSGSDSEPGIIGIMNSLARSSTKDFESFRDFPSGTLLALRKLPPESLVIVADSIFQFPQLKQQDIYRTSAFITTVALGLAEHNLPDKSFAVLNTFLDVDDDQNLQIYLTHIHRRSLRFYKKRGLTEANLNAISFTVPDTNASYDMLLDVYLMLKKIIANVAEASIYRPVLEKIKILLLAA